MNTHSGHRQRMKQRFLKEGLDNFDAVNVLELLLFYALPRRDTNLIAHDLLRRFGSLAGVLEAPVEQLQLVPGLGEHAALLISLVTSVSRYYMINRSGSAVYLRDTAQCGDYLVPRFFGMRDEAVCLLCLDAKCKVISCNMISQGSVNSAGVPIRKLVELALAANATSVVLAHNHPCGIAIPSEEDVETTNQLRDALNVVGIHLADHIIVAEEDFVSMAASNIYTPLVQE